MNGGDDVATFWVSRIVQVFGHGEDVHASAFKNSTSGENCLKNKKGKDGGEAEQTFFAARLWHLS